MDLKVQMKSNSEVSANIEATNDELKPSESSTAK